MKSYFKSIRWQIQAWYGLLLMVASIVFAVIFFQIARLEKAREIDRRINEKSFFIINSLRTAVLQQSNPLSLIMNLDSEKPFELVMDAIRSERLRIPEELDAVFQGSEPGYYFYRIEDEQGNLVLQSENALEAIELPPMPDEGVGVEFSRVGRIRLMTTSDSSGLRLLIGHDISQEIDEIRQLMRRVVAIAGGVWILGVLGGWIIAGHTIKPISAISKAAVRISEGNLNDRIQVKESGNELHELSSVLNNTFDRLQAFVERQRQFTADASHELRTPLTVILSESHRMKKKERSVAEYQESLEITLQAGNRMKKLVEDLLLLARQDSSEPNLKLETFDVHELMMEIIRSHQILAEQKEVQLSTDVQSVSFVTDPMKLSILVNNILGNAISHHHGKGNVWLSLARDEDEKEVVIKIKDDGPGISDKELPYIFDRFYRVEKARTSADHHSGLGLAVCDSIVKQFGGSIEVESKLRDGTEFVIRLPNLNV